MTYDLAYFLIHLPLLPAWALLIFAPRSELTRAYAHSAFLPVLMGLVYLGFLSAGVFFGQSAEGAGMENLAQVKALFSHPVGILTGWTHFIIFDLFIGAWIGRDAVRRGVAHPIVVICLIFTLMFGPVGLLLYLMARAVTKKGGWSLYEL